MSLERVFGNLIALMLLLLMLTGVFKCGHLLYTTVTDVILVEQPDNLVELPSYSIEESN